MKRIGLILIAILLVALPIFSQNQDTNETVSSESRLIDTIIHSTGLENNFLGDSPDRNVMIYLPPGYDESLDKHYPVVYFLHSYGVDHTAFFGGYPWYNIDFKTKCDDLISSGQIDPMIVVSPNAYNKYQGSFYVNSSVTGNWEDFIVEDLINYMDSSFRTLPQKESRGLAGHSMGGYGAMWLIMNNPSVYNAVYTLSGQPELEELYLIGGRENMIEANNYESLEGLGWRQMVPIAQAAAIAPDSLAPPTYAQLPLNKNGDLIDSIWQKWLQSEPLAMLPSLKDSLLQLKAIRFDVGSKDSDAGFISGNRNFSQALNDLDIPHIFEEYVGDHTNKLAERIETKLLPFFSANLSKHLLTDTVMIPDTAFRHALIEVGVDTNKDSLISYEEAEAVTYLDIGAFIFRGNISDMTGIEAFVNLKTLNCSNNQLTSLDISNCTVLTELRCEDNQLTSLDVSNCTSLTELKCSYNNITSLDVSNNTALTKLECAINQLTSLDVYNCTVLTELWCEDNLLTSLDISNNTALGLLGCSYNQLTSLDISNNTALGILGCRNNLLTSLDISNTTALTDLECSYNQLTSLDVSNNTALTNLECSDNQLISLDVSSNTALNWFDIGGMPDLTEVCVWIIPFPPEGIQVSTNGSPNVEFKVCSIGINGNTLSGLSFYPNPTNTLLTIETEHPDLYSINITNLNGQQILTGEMKGTPHQIDLSSFQKGVYFITIRSKDFVTTRKVIKL